MKRIFKKHRKHWSNKRLAWSSLAGITFFILSLVLNYYASIYATEKAANSVTDIIISNVPVFNVDFIVNEVALFFSLFILAMLFLNPKKIPFVFKSTALLITIRSAFITMTHLGPFPQRSYIDPTELFGPFNLGNDFFFSNHTALPFMMALLFWENKFLRNLFLSATLLFGTSVLLGHLHYSIDVFAAFFITYSTYCLAKKFFPKDYLLAEEQDLL
jgi:hypothetical protein